MLMLTHTLALMSLVEPPFFSSPGSLSCYTFVTKGKGKCQVRRQKHPQRGARLWKQNLYLCHFTTSAIPENTDLHAFVLKGTN